MKAVLPHKLLSVIIFLICSQCATALNPSLEVSQYGHKSWTQQDGLSIGTIFAIAQTSDGYFWLGGDFGLFRFDGVAATRWQPPGLRPSEQFFFRLLGARDGSLWIGTFESLLTWNGTTLIRHPEFDGRIVGSLLEDHDGTVWAGTWKSETHPARLCAMRDRRTRCYGDDGTFGKTVGALSEDSNGNLWVYAETGLWRWRPGRPQHVSAVTLDAQSMTQPVNGEIVVANYGKAVMQLDGGILKPYPIRAPGNSHQFLGEHQLDANKLLRDRDGSLWIGTVEHGLIHVHEGHTDVFTKKDGLSGDVVLSLFEDREGNVWVSTLGGIDRFREPTVTNITAAQGLASDVISSVLAAKDGSVWIATHDGVSRWKNGRTTTFREESGLPDNFTQSLFGDDSGRIWVFTHRGLAYFDGRRFAPVRDRLPSDEVYSITGDQAGNLWLSGNKGLSHLIGTRLVETFPWSALGRKQQAKVVVADGGGVWLAFWNDGGVEYFKNGRVQASYTASDGLGMGHVPGLRLDGEGALWASTQDGGLSRIKNGHVATLTTRNGLPCDNVHWSATSDDGSVWLYTVCGLVRIARSQLDGWIANPDRRIETTLWDSSDGVALGVVAPSAYGPAVAKASDGRFWFLVGAGVSVVDPPRVSSNLLSPPVHIERVVADQKTYWQNIPGMSGSNLRLPARVRDLAIDYTAVSLVAPEKVHFKYKLEGQDSDWREVVNDREVQYTNLSPRHYRFRVIACNNSGVWNEAGDSLEFEVPPAWFQTIWFRALCLVALLTLLWAGYQIRVHGLQEQEKKFREAVETMPAVAFISSADGRNTFVNRAWTEHTGLTAQQASGTGWQDALHADDLPRVRERWKAALASGRSLEYEARYRASDGVYRWFHTRADPLRDKRGKITKWCGVATDIEDRKRAEQLQSELAHVNRISTLGELAASISHELKQPITAAILTASTGLNWLRRDTPNLGKVSDALETIVNDGERAGEIIDRVRSLYKKMPPKRGPLAVNEVIGEMVKLLLFEATQNAVSIRTDLADNLPTIVADRVQLQQVLMNLMLNGLEAMHETGGVLTLKSRMTEERQVLVSVHDTGSGLPPDEVGQVFQAFFTTKPHGSGMGLAICKSIIESHDGRIWADSNDGRGATFHFSLPVNAGLR